LTEIVFSNSYYFVFDYRAASPAPSGTVDNAFYLANEPGTNRVAVRTCTRATTVYARYVAATCSRGDAPGPILGYASSVALAGASPLMLYQRVSTPCCMVYYTTGPNGEQQAQQFCQLLSSGRVCSSGNNPYGFDVQEAASGTVAPNAGASGAFSASASGAYVWTTPPT